MESLNNTLTMNEMKNDQETLSANTTFVEAPIFKEGLPVIRRSSRDITRKKLTVFVWVAATIGIIILVIIVPILGLRKTG